MRRRTIPLAERGAGRLHPQRNRVQRNTWNVYRGSNGSNAVYSFVRTSGTTAGTIDVLAVLNWLKTNGWWSDVTIGALQFGFELSGTAGQSDFVTNSMDITYN